MDRSGVIVTAPAMGTDLYRYFGSRERHSGRFGDRRPAHCMLTPYWASVHKSEFRAFQASRRGGELVCRPRRDRVEMEARCLYLEGTVEF